MTMCYVYFVFGSRALLSPSEKNPRGTTIYIVWRITLTTITNHSKHCSFHHWYWVFGILWFLCHTITPRGIISLTHVCTHSHTHREREWDWEREEIGGKKTEYNLRYIQNNYIPLSSCKKKRLRLFVPPPIPSGLNSLISCQL